MFRRRSYRRAVGEVLAAVAAKLISHKSEFGHDVSGRASKQGLRELGGICSGAIGKLREEGKKSNSYHCAVRSAE